MTSSARMAHESGGATMRFLKSCGLVAVSSLALAACGGSGCSALGARDYIRAVGSSTLYPFATAVAEQYAKTGAKSPVVESTGTTVASTQPAICNSA